MALHPALLPSQGHLTSASVCLTLAKKELQLAWVGRTQIPVHWPQPLGWGAREKRSQSNGVWPFLSIYLYHVPFQELSPSLVPSECLKYHSSLNVLGPRNSSGFCEEQLNCGVSSSLKALYRWKVQLFLFQVKNG